MTYARTTLRLKRLVATTAPANQRSISLLRRLGFGYKGSITLAGHTDESMLFEIGWVRHVSGVSH